MKLWHDDIRRPPDDSWVWARTNGEAQVLLGDYGVAPADLGGFEEISLDHDLGMDHMDPDAPNAIYLKGNSEQTGLDLVDWMIAADAVPPKVTIHSWNPSGADRMRKTLAAAGYRSYYVPYRAPNERTT